MEALLPGTEVTACGLPWEVVFLRPADAQSLYHLRGRELDEAHHCARLGAAGDRDDSQRHCLAGVLARRADGLLLTANLHDEHDAHFASLLELLDPSPVNGCGELCERARGRHIVHQRKRHTRTRDGEAQFRERAVHPGPVLFRREETPAFAAFQFALLALVVPLLQRAMTKRFDGGVLAFVSLLKRSVSTAVACASSRTFAAANHHGRRTVVRWRLPLALRAAQPGRARHRHGYADIALVEALPQPVIELGGGAGEGGQLGLAGVDAGPTMTKRKKGGGDRWGRS